MSCERLRRKDSAVKTRSDGDTHKYKKKPKGETGKRRKAEPAPSHDGAGFKISSIHASTNNNKNNNNEKKQNASSLYFIMYFPAVLSLGFSFFFVLFYSLNTNLVSCRLLSLQSGYC